MWYRRAAIESLNKQQVVPSPLLYNVNEQKLCPETLSKFITMTLDEGTQEFLDEYCKEEGFMITLFGNLLRYYYSLTDSNAILNRGQMHVLSSEQIRLLLRIDTNKPLVHAPATLLDIGAGDGNVTKKFQSIISTPDGNENEWKDRVVTTELSHYMTKRLQEQGFSCVETTVITRENLVQHLRCGEPQSSSPAFDIVTLFNVIDRCDRPLTLLKDIQKLLLPLENSGERGILLLAVVFPWGPFVESGSGQKPPTEELPVRGKNVLWPIPIEKLTPEQCEKRLLKENESLNENCVPPRTENKDICACCGKFEDCVEWMIWNVLVPEGWEVLQWTRVPYISAGDMNCRYYSLFNAVFVLTPSLPQN